jgi:hypothetical protein
MSEQREIGNGGKEIRWDRLPACDGLQNNPEESTTLARARENLFCHLAVERERDLLQENVALLLRLYVTGTIASGWFTPLS